MSRILIIITSLFFICSPLSFAQEAETQKHELELSDLSDDFGFPRTSYNRDAVKRHISKCKKCQPLADAYYEAYTSWLNAKSAKDKLDGLKYQKKQNIKDRKSRPENKEALSEKEEKNLAIRIEMNIARDEMLKKDLPAINEAIRNLEFTMREMASKFRACEKQCSKPQDKKKDTTKSIGTTTKDFSDNMPFAWKGPYAAVCLKCEKLAARLNELPSLMFENSKQRDPLMARKAYLNFNIRYYTVVGVNNREETLNLIRQYKKELKKIKKSLKRLDKNRKKIIKNFNETLKLYNKCIKKCPVKKTACLFPGEQGEKNQSIMIGPNDKYGSSAQMAKELRDKATGAVKGAATKAVGRLLGGFGGFGKFGGGGSKGPKTDKDPTKGKFTNISYGDTSLDIRASWKKDQLIVSSKINNAPGSGTFHAQWIEAQDGTIYLPVRYLTIKLYRDWKLTVSWTEDHYMNGEHIFHDAGRNITTGRDHLGTWNLFKGAEGVANSIWGMLGFETAVKGVKQLGAIYDIPPSAFSDSCQMQLVTHISQPKGDPVTTVPLVGDLFKHVDESKKKPKLLVLVQPHIL